METTTQLLTDSEAAAVLSLTSRQVLRLANRGELPSVRLPNRQVRFDPRDLSRFIENCKRGGQSLSSSQTGNGDGRARP
jgi:excisionase family DNA binding protein